MVKLPQFRYTGKLDESELYYHLRTTHKLIVYQGSIFYYDDKYWRRLSDSEGASCLWSAIPKEKRGTLSPSIIDKAFKRFIADPANTYDLDALRERYVNYINVSNGEYNVKTQTLDQHKLTHGFSYVLNFQYVKNANITECKNFINFARTSLDFDSNPAKVKRLLQMIGYCVSSLEGAEKAFFFVGPSNCGKSVIANLIELVVGEIHTVNFPINRLADRFNIGQLRNARVNVNREMTGSKLANIDIFKSIVSNERINGEQKFGQPFSFKCHCKLLFAGNTIFQLAETDGKNEAIFNRLCVLTFKNGLNDGQKDLQLLKKLSEERDIIFSSAVDMLKELSENNYVFQEDCDSTSYLDAYKEEQQALPNFIAECCILSSENKTHTKDIISAFKQYCKDNSLINCYSDRDISMYISDLDGVTRKKLRINNSNPLYGYEGIGLKM